MNVLFTSKLKNNKKVLYLMQLIHYSNKKHNLVNYQLLTIKLTLNYHNNIQLKQK